MRLFELLVELDLPKNQWVIDISNADKTEVGSDLISLVQTAYSNIPQGSFVNSIKDVIPSDWNIVDWDQDPDVDACVFYRNSRPAETWSGSKIQGVGHDGARGSKDRAIQKVQTLLQKPGWWIESSDAMRAVLLKLNAVAITDEAFLQRLFNDPDLRMINENTYTRKINSATITETVFGHPILKK